MGYKVTAPLVIIASADGVAGDWYGYDGALVPAGLNDERCKVLAKEGMLEKVKDDAPAPAPATAPSGDSKPDTVEGILAEVGDDKEKAAAALEAEVAGKNRSTLVKALEDVLNAES